MATTAHVGDTRALVFPVMCDGHLKIEYDDYNSNDLTGSNTIDESRHPLWDYGGPFSIEAIVTPYDVNGVGHRTSGQGRLDSTKTPPSPNLSLDDQADTTSNYESVSYFGAGRGTHKMMIFCNDYLKFYLQNTTSSNFNQPAEYKLVVELTDSIGTPISHTVASEPVFVSKKSLTGYYDPDGLYSGITTDKTKITSSATGSLPTATAQVTGNLASFANTQQTLGTATILVENSNLPNVSDGTLDTSPSSGTAPTGSITVDSIGSSDCFSSFTAVGSTLADAINACAITIFNDGTTAADTFKFIPVTSSDIGSDRNGDNLQTLITNRGGDNGVVQDALGSIPANNVFVFEISNDSSGTVWNNINNLHAIIGSNANSATITGLNLFSTYLGSGKTLNLSTLTSVSTSTLANYNNTITKGSDVSDEITLSGMSGGVNATSSVTNINHYLTIKCANASGSVSGNRTQNFKFYPTGTNGTTTTTQNGTTVRRVIAPEGTGVNTVAARLRNAINDAFGSGTASSTGATVTITSPNTSGANQPPSTPLAMTSEYSTHSVVTFGNNPYQNFVAANTPTAFITLEDSAGLVKKYKPTKGDNSETNGSTATEGSNDVVFFTNVVGNTQTTAQNLRTAINGSSGHNGSLTVSRSGSTLTIVAASAGDQAISNTGISSGLTIGAFSTNVNDINVGSGEADGIGAGNEIYNNVGTLIGTVSSVSGNTITLASAPATTVTGTIYREQQKEALYLEQPSKVGMSFDGNTITLYLNNQPVKRAKVNIGKFRLDTSPGDCFIGQNGTLSATARKATQFMGELYEIAFHKSATPCPTITTLTPNYSDTLFYYSFGD